MRWLLLIMSSVAIVSWALLGLLVWFVPPKIEGKLIISNFSYVLFLGTIALGLTLSLFLYFVESLFTPTMRGNTTYFPKKLLIRAFRRGFLLSFTVAIVVVLKVLQLLNLLNFTLVVGIAILIEIYFSSR